MPMLMTVRMRLPVCPFHAPLRTRSEKSAIASITAWTSRTTSLAVHDDRRPARRTQRDVQNGPVFRQVDLVSPEHGVDALAQPGLVGETTQQRERLVRHAILGVVEVDAGRLRGQAHAAHRIVGEEPPQGLLADLLLVSLARFPRLTRGQWQHSRHRSSFQLALARAALFLAITSMSSCQELTNDFAPSS